MKHTVPLSLCTALKCDKPVTPHHEERALGYSSVFVVKRASEGEREGPGLVQQPSVPDVDGFRHPVAWITSQGPIHYSCQYLHMESLWSKVEYLFCFILWSMLASISTSLMVIILLTLILCHHVYIYSPASTCDFLISIPQNINNPAPEFELLWLQ